MKAETLGRMAASCIIAVIAGVELLTHCDNPPIAMIWWLVFTIAAGVFLNSRVGERILYLAFASLAPAVVPLFVLAYPAIILDQEVCFSGAKFSEFDRGTRIVIVMFFIAVSWMGIFLFSFARSGLLAALKLLARDQTSQNLHRIEATIRAACAVVGACALLYASCH